MDLKAIVTKYHHKLIEERWCQDRLDAVAHLVTGGIGLSADDVRGRMATNGGADLVVMEEQVGDGVYRRSVHQKDALPEGTRTVPLDEAVNAFATARDVTRARRIARAETAAPLAGFDGGPVEGTSEDRRLQRLRGAAFNDLRELKGIRSGVPDLAPPNPTQNGKLSSAAIDRYAQEQLALNGVLDAEVARLQKLTADRMDAAVQRAPAYTTAKLAHVLKELPAAEQTRVRRAIATGERADGTYLVTRPGVDRQGQPTMNFMTREYSPQAGGRPTPSSIARDLGLPDVRGVRVASVAELLQDARAQLQEEAAYGDAALNTSRPLFEGPAK